MLALLLLASLAQTPPPPPPPIAASCASDLDCAADERCTGHQSLGEGQWSRGTCRSRSAPTTPQQVVSPLEPKEERFEYKGQVPAGFRLVEEPRFGLIVPGSILLGVGYGVTALIGLAVGIPSAAIPLVGPIFFAAEAWQPAGFLSLGVVANFFIVLLVAVELAAQVAGSVLLIAGLAKPKRWLERSPVTVVPQLTGDTGGLAVVGRF